MAYTDENGFIPDTVEELMNDFMNGINNKFGTSYTIDTFVGSNFYKYFYVIAQQIIDKEIVFAQAFQKLQDYIRSTNETIAIAKTPLDGLIKVFSDAGYQISIEPMTALNAGTLGVCVDVDSTDPDYADMKTEILTMLKDYTVAGIFFSGAETGNIALTNGQSFEFGYALPTEFNAVELKISIELSQNVNIVPDSESEIKTKLLANLADRYSIGRDFEPNRYFDILNDAPYASSVLLQWRKTSGDAWSSAVYSATFKEVFRFDTSRITVVIS